MSYELNFDVTDAIAEGIASYKHSQLPAAVRKMSATKQADYIDAKVSYNLYRVARDKILTGQSVSMGSRSLTRADLDKVESWMGKYKNIMEEIEESGTTRRKFKGVSFGF